LTFEWKFLFDTTYTFELIIPFQVNWHYSNMLKCVNFIEIRSYAYLYAKATLLKILSVQRFFLQYKSQCLEKVNVKYVIKRLWHEIFHIVPGINPRPISTLQLRCRAWYGSLGLIPGPIWYEKKKKNANKTLKNNICYFWSIANWTLKQLFDYSLNSCL
jgi:hypothetical protein